MCDWMDDLCYSKAKCEYSSENVMICAVDCAHEAHTSDRNKWNEMSSMCSLSKKPHRIGTNAFSNTKHVI